MQIFKHGKSVGKNKNMEKVLEKIEGSHGKVMNMSLGIGVFKPILLLLHNFFYQYFSAFWWSAKVETLVWQK